MTTPSPAPTEQLRLLECWLPLAQALCERAGWSDGPAQIEALILAAAPALSRAGSPAEANAILWSYHRAQSERQP